MFLAVMPLWPDFFAWIEASRMMLGIVSFVGSSGAERNQVLLLHKETVVKKDLECPGQ